MPRALGAGLAISLVVGGCAALTYSLMDDALEVVDQLPVAARKVRSRLETDHAPTAIEKVQEAAREIDAAAAAAASPETAAPPGVARVVIEEPAFRASDYVWWSSLGALSLLGQASLVLFLAFFLLVYDDLFKRKLVENIGPTLGRKRITVQILNDIAAQIEGFIAVQVFTQPGSGNRHGPDVVGGRVEQPVGVGRRGRGVERGSLLRSVDRRRRPWRRRLPAVRVRPRPPSEWRASRCSLPLSKGTG